MIAITINNSNTNTILIGGKTPVLSKQRYIELGYQMANSNNNDNNNNNNDNTNSNGNGNGTSSSATRWRYHKLLCC